MAMLRLVGAAALLLAGCSGVTASQSQWTKPNLISGQMELDMYICRNWSTVGRTFSESHFSECMAAKGYRPSDGPPSTAVAAR
jgi:hypothetical protein